MRENRWLNFFRRSEPVKTSTSEKEKSQESQRLCVVETLLSMANRLADINWQQEPYSAIKQEAIARREKAVAALKTEIQNQAQRESARLFQQLYPGLELKLRTEADQDGTLHGTGIHYKSQAAQLAKRVIAEQFEQRFNVGDRRNIREQAEWFWAALAQATGLDLNAKFVRFDPYHPAQPDELEAIFHQPNQEAGVLLQIGMSGISTDIKGGNVVNLSDNHMSHVVAAGPDEWQIISEGALHGPGKSRQLSRSRLRLFIGELAVGTGIFTASDQDEPWNLMLVTKT